MVVIGSGGVSFDAGYDRTSYGTVCFKKTARAAEYAKM